MVFVIPQLDGAGSGNTMVSRDRGIKSKAWVGVTGRGLLVSPDSGDTALRRRLPARSHNAPGLLYTAFPCQSPPHYLQRPRSLAGPDLLINKALSAGCMGLHTRRLEQILKPFFLYKQVTLVTSSQLSRGFLSYIFKISLRVNTIWNTLTFQ